MRSGCIVVGALIVMAAAGTTGCAPTKSVVKKTQVVEPAKVTTKESVMEAKTVVLETTQGPIEIKLMPEVAPKATENFVKLTEQGYYNGLIFHRVIKGFMLQGGDPTGTGRGGQSVWGKPFEDEVTSQVTFNKPGILAMANAGPGTNGSQFFITTAATPWLNNNHTIFGEVVSGMDTVKKIEEVETGPMDKPKEDQKIIKAYIKE